MARGRRGYRARLASAGTRARGIPANPVPPCRRTLVPSYHRPRRRGLRCGWRGGASATQFVRGCLTLRRRNSPLRPLAEGGPDVSRQPFVERDRNRQAGPGREGAGPVHNRSRASPRSVHSGSGAAHRPRHERIAAGALSDPTRTRNLAPRVRLQPLHGGRGPTGRRRRKGGSPLGRRATQRGHGIQPRRDRRWPTAGRCSVGLGQEGHGCRWMPAEISIQPEIVPVPRWPQAAPVQRGQSRTRPEISTTNVAPFEHPVRYAGWVRLVDSGSGG